MKHLYTLNLTKVLLIVAVITCSSFARGQSFDYNPYDTVEVRAIHNEIGINFSSPPNFESLSTFIKLPASKSIYWWTIIFSSGYDTTYWSNDYVFSNKVSYFYKFHWKKHALRFGFMSNSLTYESDVDSTHWNATIAGWYRSYGGSYQIQKFIIGYERNYSIKKFDFYCALDFAYYWGSIAGAVINHYGSTNSGFSSIYDYTYNINLKEYSLSPTLGIRFRFWQIFALSSEINCNFLYYKATDPNGHYPSSSQFKVYTNPLSSFALSLYL